MTLPIMMTLPIILITACGLLAVTVAVLARNRWIQTHPLRACVVLSIVTHALLVIAICGTDVWRLPRLPPGDGAITVRVEVLKPSQTAAGDPGGEPVSGVSPPAADTSSADPADASPSEDLRKDPPEDPLPELIARTDPSPTAVERTESEEVESPKSEEPEEVVQAEPLSAPPTPEPSALEPSALEPLGLLPLPTLGAELGSVAPPVSAPSATLDAIVPTLTPVPSIDPRMPPAAPLVASPPATDFGGGQWEAVPPLASNVPSPNRYRGRSPQGRSRDTVLRGGSAKTEAAVQAALDWLAAAQAPDGRWNPQAHGAGCGGVIEGQQRGTTGIRADTGISALSLLAFLAHGETHREGRHRDVVERGLHFLIRSQAANGDLGGQADIHARMYCHGMGTLALAEAYGMTGDAALLGPLRRAVRFSVACQDRYTGGWRYRPGESGDTSQFGWHVMALTSASRAGVRDGDVAIDGMHRFLASVSSGTHGGLAAYRPGSPPTRSMTAEALVCRWCLGPVDSEVLDEASRFIMQQPPGSGRPNLYSWYYASLALCQLDAPAWPQWNQALMNELLGLQRQWGSLQGSWDPDTVWGPCGGRIYTTAVATLCLEVYYRYAPTASSP